MYTNIQKLKKARELRLSGLSISEIAKDINSSRSSVSSWCKDIVLNDKQKLDLKQRIAQYSNRGRLNASVANRARRVYAEKIAYDEAERDFPRLIKDPFFVIGLTLYFSKGSKEGGVLQFTASKLSMINIMNLWFKKYLLISDSVIKHYKYDKSYRIYIGNVALSRKVAAWQKLLIKYYNSVLV